MSGLERCVLLVYVAVFIVVLCSVIGHWATADGDAARKEHQYQHDYALVRKDFEELELQLRRNEDMIHRIDELTHRREELECVTVQRCVLESIDDHQ